MAILVLERCYMIMNLLFVLTFVLLHSAHCFNPKRLNVSAVAGDSDWSLAAATFYGLPTGYGTDGIYIYIYIYIYLMHIVSLHNQVILLYL